MLMEYGNPLCDWDWNVEEKDAPGFCRVYSVYGGEVNYRDEHRSFPLKPGNLYVFPSASPYYMSQNRENPLHCTYLHLDIIPAMLANPIEIALDREPALRHLFLSIAASIEQRDDRMTNGLTSVFESYCADHRLLQLPDGPVAEMLSYIASHIAEDISIADLSARAGYNAHYFIRLFKKSVGLAPHRYITGIRLKEAKRLLLTNATVSEVAKATGYSDNKAFSRAFKNVFGLSPSDYRKAYTAQP